MLAVLPQSVPFTTKDQLAQMCERHGIAEVLDRLVDVVDAQASHAQGDRHLQLDALAQALQEVLEQALRSGL